MHLFARRSGELLVFRISRSQRKLAVRQLHRLFDAMVWQGLQQFGHVANQVIRLRRTGRVKLNPAIEPLP